MDQKDIAAAALTAMMRGCELTVRRLGQRRRTLAAGLPHSQAKEVGSWRHILTDAGSLKTTASRVVS